MNNNGSNDSMDINFSGGVSSKDDDSSGGVEMVYSTTSNDNNSSIDNNKSSNNGLRRRKRNLIDDNNSNDNNSNYSKGFESEDPDALDREDQLNRPLDTAMMQQRIKAWQPYLDPVWIIVVLFALSIILIPTGYRVKLLADEIIEVKVTYDHPTARPTSPPTTTNIDAPFFFFSANETPPTNNNENVPICGIGTTVRQGRKCLLNFTAPADMEPPILVYYEIENFHQNHRSYYSSLDPYQLYGQLARDQDSFYAQACQPLNRLGNISLNPCGLIANTFFNDIFTLQSPTYITMIEEGIAWQSDLEYKYRQPDGFHYEVCPEVFNCSSECCHPSPPGGRPSNSHDNISLLFAASQEEDNEQEQDEDEIRNIFSPNHENNDVNNNNNNNNANEQTSLLDHYEWSCETPYVDPNDNGTCYRYYYPDDNTTQYLYETYPEVISPIEGILNEHFVVWMRVATMPTFRKLYGFIDQRIPANTTIQFEVTANYVVESFGGSKSLVLTTNNMFGGKTYNMALSFVSVGCFSGLAAIFFTLKHTFRRRRIADRVYLHYSKEDH